MSINSRIFRSLTEDINLIYYLKDEGYIFYILGTSGFIYKVKITKSFQNCNCEDYLESKFCKHICFVLFRLLKIFRYDKKKDIVELITKNSLLSTKFFYNFKFEENEYIELINKFNMINLLLKKSFFNQVKYLKFNKLYNNYNIFKNNLILENKLDCVICLQDKGIMTKCPNCNNIYHLCCILKWLSNVKDNMRCPICKSEIWKDIYPLLLIYLNIKMEATLV
jgi:hypothetical protein